MPQFNREPENELIDYDKIVAEQEKEWRSVLGMPPKQQGQEQKPKLNLPDYLAGFGVGSPSAVASAVSKSPNRAPISSPRAASFKAQPSRQPGIANQAAIEALVKGAPMAVPSIPSVPEFTPSIAPMSEVNQGAMIKALMSGTTGRGRSDLSDLSRAAGEIPKTKAGLNKFMQEYGKFIALGAMAGQGGRGGQIAAPIMAALPGLIEMLKGKKSSKSSGAPKSSVQTGMAHGGSVGKKSSGGEPPKKSEGGAIRKFKGGSMKGNSMDSMLTPKYAKGGKTDKTDKMDKMGKMGKAAGEMPQHKKMAMGKPTPQSTGQKFAKGGTMKCATGGGVKGYGIAKKIRPTGPMN